MQQAAFLNGLSLDLLSSSEDGFCPAEADVGRRQGAEALVVSMVVVCIVPAESMVRFSGIALQPTLFGEVAVVRC